MVVGYLGDTIGMYAAGWLDHPKLVVGMWAIKYEAASIFLVSWGKCEVSEQLGWGGMCY